MTTIVLTVQPATPMPMSKETTKRIIEVVLARYSNNVKCLSEWVWNLTSPDVKLISVLDVLKENFGFDYSTHQFDLPVFFTCYTGEEYQLYQIRQGKIYVFRTSEGTFHQISAEIIDGNLVTKFNKYIVKYL